MIEPIKNKLNEIPDELFEINCSLNKALLRAKQCNLDLMRVKLGIKMCQLPIGELMLIQDVATQEMIRRGY